MVFFWPLQWYPVDVLFASNMNEENIATTLILPNTIRESTTRPPGLFTCIFNVLFSRNPPKSGPLVTNGVYHSYEYIYKKVSLIPSHHPPHKHTITSNSAAKFPYRIAYYIWKPQPKFKKSDPPPPDFRIAVVSAREVGIPTLAQLSALFDSVPVDTAAAGKNIYQKLKDGYRNVIVAVVDFGVTSFLKFADVGFGDETLYKRRAGGHRGGKYGGRGGRWGRGGRSQCRR
jgi:tRNA-splicing endonuclease subunit Sen54